MDQFEIVPYQSGLRDGVLSVLRHLLGDDEEINRKYFGWKYEENPFVTGPPGVVARHNENVIGFRGYFATQWTAGGHEALTFLCPGDTCVDPGYRRLGLSVKMGKAALAACVAGARLLVNMSSTKGSLPGYLRLGFAPVTARTFIHAASWPGMTRFLVASLLKTGPVRNRIGYGESEGIVVSERPDSEAMARLAGAGAAGRQTIRLVQDRTFFEWRFRNPRNRYVFYLRRGASDWDAYAIVRLSPNGRRGYLVDHAQSEAGALDELIRFIARSKHFDILSVWSCGMEPATREIFLRHGFRQGLFSMVEARRRGECPILVRPVTAEPREEDWIIGGLDVRDHRNWQIRQIGSDGV